MEIIILITALVLVVSLYDFFTSRSWQQVTSSSRNEVVFGERNKEYGAYQIRRDYDRNFIFILLGVIGTVGIAYGALLFFRTEPLDDIKFPPADYLVTTLEIPPVEINNVTPPPSIEQRQAAPVRTDQFTVLTVTDNDANTKPPIQDVLGNNQIGNQATSGSTTSFTTPVTQPGTGTAAGSGGNDIEEFVDIDAVFPGGISEMMKYLSKNIRYPEIALQTGAQGKAVLRFVVGKDGNIENVTVARGVPGCPECDKEAMRVVKSMPKWEPAQNKGKVVKSYFTLPVTFKIK